MLAYSTVPIGILPYQNDNSLVQTGHKLLRFVDDARTAARKSVDRTKVGCVVIDDDLCIRTSGWNGFPRKVKHTYVREERPTKYFYTSHAEENAIAQAARIGVSLKGCTLIVTALYPCSTCARLIIQSGIVRVLAPDVDMPEKWSDEWEHSWSMLNEAGVDVFVYSEDLTTLRVYEGPRG